MSRGQRDDRLRRDIIGIGLAALGAVVLVSLVYGQQGTGFLPQIVSQGLLLAFGVGAYLTPVILLALAVLYMLESRDLGGMRMAMGLGLLFLIVIILFQLSVPLADFFAREAVLEAGGYVGAALGWLLLKIVGLWGSYIVLFALGVIAILLVTRVSVQGLAGRTISMLTEGGVRARRTVSRNLPGRDADLRARAEKAARVAPACNLKMMRCSLARPLKEENVRASGHHKNRIYSQQRSGQLMCPPPASSSQEDLSCNW